MGYACTLAHTPAQVLAGTIWESGNGLGNFSQSYDPRRGWWVGLSMRNPGATGLEMDKTRVSFPGCWCWDSLSFPGTHIHPRRSALPPCTYATLSSCCSSGCPLSLPPRTSSLAGKLTEIHLLRLGLTQGQGWNRLCVLRINLAKSTFVQPT